MCVEGVPRVRSKCRLAKVIRLRRRCLSSSSCSESLGGFSLVSIAEEEGGQSMMRVVVVVVVVVLLLCQLSYALCRLVVADEIIPAHLGGTLSRGSRESNYNIEFHPEDSPFHPDDDQEAVVMPNSNGENFLCYLPRVEKAKSGKPVAQHNKTSMIVETEKRVKLKTPDELLEEHKGQCFVRQEGWWTYEFCYHQKLRQVHLEDEKLVQEFVLGVYDAEATVAFNQNLSDISTLKDPRSKDASLRYHAHLYTNGTICDLTNQPRETEVRFVCSEPRVMISSITELSTCKYALTIHTPMLCKHQLFQAERPVWHIIHCNTLPKNYMETKVNKELNKQIIMVTDNEDASSYDPEQ